MVGHLASARACVQCDRACMSDVIQRWVAAYMCICARIHVYAHNYIIHMHACNTEAYTRVRANVHRHARTHAHTHARTYACMHAGMFVICMHF